MQYMNKWLSWWETKSLLFFYFSLIWCFHRASIIAWCAICVWLVHKIALKTFVAGSFMYISALPKARTLSKLHMICFVFINDKPPSLRLPYHQFPLSLDIHTLNTDTHTRSQDNGMQNSFGVSHLQCLFFLHIFLSFTAIVFFRFVFCALWATYLIGINQIELDWGT